MFYAMMMPVLYILAMLSSYKNPECHYSKFNVKHYLAIHLYHQDINQVLHKGTNIQHLM